MLELAVPQWIEALRPLTFNQRAALAHECAEIVAHKGDVILYKSEKRGETAAAFNALAKGIAVLAYQPGGVRVFGRSFNARIPIPR